MWQYRGKEITDSDVPADAIGFVYKIERTDGKIYIGKKLLTSTRKSKLGVRAIKKQVEEYTDKRRIKKVQVKVKESNWKTYNSSNKELAAEIKEQPELFRKTIIEWCWSKKHLSYMEEKMQHLYGVLEIDNWNDNIGGRYFKRDLIKPNKNV